MANEMLSLQAILKILDLEEPEKDRADENRRQKLIVALFSEGLKFKKGIETNSVIMCDTEGIPALIIRREGGLKFESGSF